ncbi:hypothetical protein MMC26_001145 [Xylographa opegraphella]|nr:hypothetical protein [Xylographa opegraphella]
MEVVDLVSSSDIDKRTFCLTQLVKVLPSTSLPANVLMPSVSLIYARNRPRITRTSAPSVLSVPTPAAAPVDIALAPALVELAATVARVAEVMVALDVRDARVVDVTGFGNTGPGNEPVLLPIMLALIIVSLLIVSSDVVMPLDIAGTVEVVPRMAEGVGILVVVPRMAEGVGTIAVVVPGPAISVRVGIVVAADTAPIAPHEAAAHWVQLCATR